MAQQLSVKSVIPLPYATVEPRWLQLIPQSGSVLIYNSSRADLYSVDVESSTLSRTADLTSVLAAKYKPRQMKVCDAAGSQLLVTGADRKCHLVDTATGQSLAATLGEHDFFAVERHDKFAYLIDYHQELLVRYNWPTMRNACALSLIRKTDSALSTVLDSLQPWHLAMAGGSLLVTKSHGSGGGAFSEAHAAVCLNAHQRQWTGALAKPEKPPAGRQQRRWTTTTLRKSTAAAAAAANVRQKSVVNPDDAAGGGGAAQLQASNRCYGKYWLPGDRYLACWDGGASRHQPPQAQLLLFMSSPAEGAVYVYGQSSSSSATAADTACASSSSSSKRGRDAGLSQSPSFLQECRGVLCLSTALAGLLAEDGDEEDGHSRRQQAALRPGCLAVDPARRLLLALVGDSYAGENFLVACDISGC